jgi:hypothetical protein
MFVVGGRPSRPVPWLALLRLPAMAPAWARPCSASPPNPAAPTLTTCMFQAASVKPSRKAQSCIRLCMANRLLTAASASLRCALVKTAGSHLAWCHWSVNG